MLYKAGSKIKQLGWKLNNWFWKLNKSVASTKIHPRLSGLWFTAHLSRPQSSLSTLTLVILPPCWWGFQLLPATSKWHAPKQGIALMIDSGTQMRPINLNQSLVDHSVILGIEHTVAVPVSLRQDVCEHRTEDADFLIHDKHEVPSICPTNYPIHIPLVAAFQEYHQYFMNKGIGERKILAKSDGYPMEIVQLKITINNLEMRRGGWSYACMITDLDCRQRESQGGSRQIGRLGL